MREVNLRHPGFLPPLWRSARLLVASDFTGDQRGSRYSTFSFVIAPIEGVAQWDQYRHDLRRRFALKARRISYAKLNDRRKRAAIFEFLYLANALSGLSITVLIDKRITSLFTNSGYVDPTDISVGGKTFDRWKPLVFERVMRAATFVGLFIAGLSHPGQDVTWITDEDEIAPNVAGLTDLTHVFAHVMGNMLQHAVGHIRVGTTGTTAGDDLAMEDLSAITDLVAGSVNDFICSYGPKDRFSSVISLAPSNISPKVHNLVANLFDVHAPLRKMIFLIEPVEGSTQLRYSQLKIHLQPGLVIT